MRWAAKRDASEPGIIAALEARGWLVVRISDAGLPDLMACRAGIVLLLECKTGAGKVTPAQAEMFRRIRASGVPVAIVATPDAALEAARNVSLASVLPAQGTNATPPASAPTKQRTPRTRQPQASQGYGANVTPNVRRGK